MANNNKHTGPNVPALRFPEFSGEWEKVLLSSACEINPMTGSLDNQFLYIDLESVVKGSLVKRQIIEKDGAPSRAQRVLKENDILYQCVRPYQLNNYIFEGDTIQCVASTGYAQLRTTQFPLYIFQALHTKQFTNQVLERCTGTNYPAINSSDLGTVEVPICSLPEQVKIGSLLALIDSRIKTQNKIIEELKTLRSALRYKLLDEMMVERTAKLGELCRITTGKLDANAMVEGGGYPFFTCAEQVYEIDRYAFDTEALLVSGNGANLGHIHYYCGKFNAYQRTYVLSDFSEDIQYLRQYLEAYLSKRIESEKNTGNTPYIVLGTLADMEIKLPKVPEQQRIAHDLSVLSQKIENETHMFELFIQEKKTLLGKMFI